MTSIEEARQFAEAAHAGQTRKGASIEPYIGHVAEVAASVAAFGGSEAQVIAAWLHDTVEDCGVSLDEINERFGAGVAALVGEVTDDKSLPKAERKQLQVDHAPKKSDGAALIKICDKLSNIRAVGNAPPVHWPLARQLAYLDWAEAVVGRLPAGADPVREVFADALASSRRLVSARVG